MLKYSERLIAMALAMILAITGIVLADSFYADGYDVYDDVVYVMYLEDDVYDDDDDAVGVKYFEDDDHDNDAAGVIHIETHIESRVDATVVRITAREPRHSTSECGTIFVYLSSSSVTLPTGETVTQYFDTPYEYRDAWIESIIESRVADVCEFEACEMEYEQNIALQCSHPESKQNTTPQCSHPVGLITWHDLATVHMPVPHGIQVLQNTVEIIVCGMCGWSTGSLADSVYLGTMMYNNE